MIRNVDQDAAQHYRSDLSAVSPSAFYFLDVYVRYRPGRAAIGAAVSDGLYSFAFGTNH
ncbi:MAG: hypothetical protein WBC04_23360 [Candidatus Acidiferrales bacterium]